MGEQRTIAISGEEYKKMVEEIVRFDILKEELIEIYGEYVDDEVKDRLLRIAGIDTEDVTGREAEVAEVINK